MPSMDKQQQIEWVPIVFVLAACYIVTLLVFAHGIGDAAMQIGGGIATTFGGAAAGAYGSKLLQNRNAATRATDGMNPTQSVDPTRFADPTHPNL